MKCLLQNFWNIFKEIYPQCYMDSVVISRFKSSITHKCVNRQKKVKNWACTSIALLPWKVLNTLDKSWTVHTIKCLPDFSTRKMSYKIKKYLTLYITLHLIPQKHFIKKKYLYFLLRVVFLMQIFLSNLYDVHTE